MCLPCLLTRHNLLTVGFVPTMHWWHWRRSNRMCHFSLRKVGRRVPIVTSWHRDTGTSWHPPWWVLDRFGRESFPLAELCVFDLLCQFHDIMYRNFAWPSTQLLHKWTRDLLWCAQVAWIWYMYMIVHAHAQSTQKKTQDRPGPRIFFTHRIV